MPRTLATLSLLSLLLLPRIPALAADFTQADLVKMVTELDKVIPENPHYKYPVNCSIVDSNEVNAYATWKKDGDAKQSTMVVYSGLVKAIGGDQRLIRAVVAHELAHLSRGHLDDLNPAARDLKNLWTRQQEFEADKYGAEALTKAGYNKKDMVDMLLFLDSRHGRNGWWLDGLTADHADPKARAAEIADDPSALKALITFDTALAFEDARSHQYAMKLFDYAADQWPPLTEARINSARCALLAYYDNLPKAVRTQWWRPDFGALITNPHAKPPKGVGIEEQDREAWRDAMTAINRAIKENPASEDAKALLALGQVLEPDSNKAIVQQGIDWFKAAAASATDDVLKLRYANNAAVGYSQLDDLQSAYQTIIDAQRATTKFNAALGENLGLVVVSGRSKEDDTLAATVLYTWLSNTPESSSPRWPTVKKTFDDICAKAGIQLSEIKERPAYLCQVMTLVTDNKRMGLLLPASGLEGLLGTPEQRITFADKWPDLQELRWNAGSVSVLTERGKVMRMTSYRDGAYLELKPSDPTSQLVLKVSVGMSKTDLFEILSEKSSVMKDLAKAGKLESWNYFPDLGMGALIDGDKVVGITVTPVQYEEAAG